MLARGRWCLVLFVTGCVISGVGAMCVAAAPESDVDRAISQEEFVEGGAGRVTAVFAEDRGVVAGRRRPLEVRGIYATAWVGGSSAWFKSLLRLIARTELNAIVVDVKDDTGRIAYASGVELARAIGATGKYDRIADIRELLRWCEELGIYPIARLVVFKDPVLAEAMPHLATHDRHGGIWRDRTGHAWADPYNRRVWAYNLAIAREAAAMGFKEIQFDYVRFPSDGRIEDCVYPGADGSSKVEVISSFLRYAARRLRGCDVFVSADIFGLVCSADGDLGIGQRLEEIAREVDYICPMVYPSHYRAGTYGLANPDAAPYETVLRSLLDARRRLSENGAILRPWLQDFSLGHRYGVEEVLAQIRAVRDAGVREWLLWSPSCSYTEGALRGRERE